MSDDDENQTNVPEDEEQLGENMVSRKIYNDVIDEEVDIDAAEDIEVPNEKHEKIENNHVDEVVQISTDNEEEEVPSPKEGNSELQDEQGQMNQAMAFGQGQGGDDMGNGEEGGFDGYNPEDYMNLNVPPQIKEIFKYITM